MAELVEENLPGWTTALDVNDYKSGDRDISDFRDFGFNEYGFAYADTEPERIYDRYVEWYCARRTLLENAMLSAINTLTDKPEWRTKIKDDTIRMKWHDEIKTALRPTVVESSSAHSSEEVPEQAADFCIEELLHRAEYEKPYTTILGLGGADIIKFDEVPDELRQRLKTVAEKLADEQVEINLQPGDDKVRHLIHPSLHPLHFGVSKINKNLSKGGCVIPVPLAAKHYSTEFQWLPSEWSGTFTSPVYGSIPELNDVLDDLVRFCIPLWERCIARNVGRGIRRIETKEEELWVGFDVEDLPTAPDEFEDSDGYSFNLQDEIKAQGEKLARKEQQEMWLRACRIPLCPLPGKFSEFVEEAGHTPYKLPERLQIIVKISEIHLTPGSPDWGGGNWHVEGLANEHICATAIFYYDVHNIESDIAFSSIALMADFEYEQGTYSGLDRVFGTFLSDEKAEQDLPSVHTQQGRLLVFPNVFKHCVRPFQLSDRNKPGHRKMVVLWLVNPDKRILSTAHVKPQDVSQEQILQNQRDLMAERSVSSSKYIEHDSRYGFCEH